MVLKFAGTCLRRFHGKHYANNGKC